MFVVGAVGGGGGGRKKTGKEGDLAGEFKNKKTRDKQHNALAIYSPYTRGTETSNQSVAPFQ